MAKHGEGLGDAIVKAVNNGEIIEPITAKKVEAFCKQKGWKDVSKYHMRNILSNSTENTHSPGYKKYFVRIGAQGSGKYKLAPVYRRKTSYYWLNVDSDSYEWSFSSMAVGDREDYSSVNEDGRERHIPKCFKDIHIGDKVLSYETDKKSITAICEVVDKIRKSGGEIIVIFEKRKGFEKYLSLDEIKKLKHMEGSKVVGFHRGTLFELEKNHYNELVRTLETLNDSEEEFYKEVQEYKSISSEERKRILSETADTLPETLEVVRTEYKRNPCIIAEVLERANGKCERCKREAPFNRIKDGTPYLEVHHKIWLKNGGEDTVDNAIALCPNCHKELHYGV